MLSPTSSDEDPTIQHFLKGANLRKVFSHLCNNATGQVTDPIAYVVHIMLTCPVQMVVSEVGVALFKDHPNALYPFTAMDIGQRLYVEGVVTSCMNWHARTSVSCDGESGQNSKVVMQMGGGCILHLASSSSSSSSSSAGGVQPNKKQSLSPLLLRTGDVMEALCDCIFSSKRYGNARVRHAVCSIVMQRVVGMCSGSRVGREEQRAAFAYALGKLKEEDEQMAIEAK